MKKIVLLLTILIAFTSCESEVKFNTPAFQVFKDNALWRADNTKNNISNGVLTMTAFRGSEQISLVVPAPTTEISTTNPVTYILGVDDIKYATYKITEEDITLSYKTGEEIGNGEITITEYNPSTKTLSGNFKFNATYQGTNTSVSTNSNFQEGFIYKIQIQ
ncbi:MAG: DUF6252 family protein [Flavobacterium sp.]